MYIKFHCFPPSYDYTCKCACATMSPTGSTVLGDVLIASSTDKVGSVDISPVPGCRQLHNIHIFMKTWHSPEKNYPFKSGTNSKQTILCGFKGKKKKKIQKLDNDKFVNLCKQKSQMSLEPVKKLTSHTKSLNRP